MVRLFLDSHACGHALGSAVANSDPAELLAVLRTQRKDHDVSQPVRSVTCVDGYFEEAGTMGDKTCTPDGDGPDGGGPGGGGPGGPTSMSEMVLSRERFDLLRERLAPPPCGPGPGGGPCGGDME